MAPEGPRSGGPARRRLVLVLGLDHAMWQAVEGEGAQGVGLPALRCCELNSGERTPDGGSREIFLPLARNSRAISKFAFRRLARSASLDFCAPIF